MDKTLEILPQNKVKQLYPYQTLAIQQIMEGITQQEVKKNIIFQLPTGGGKTVIFSEITKRFVLETGKKVLILTHRIELLKQTYGVLEEVGIASKIIVSDVDKIDDHESFSCYLAMVETLNNRLQEYENYLPVIDLVIVDEAHYNSFRKIFQYFKGAVILGFTATPLSSNINLPLKENYQRRIVGDSIPELIKNQYLSEATTFTFDVNLESLKIGIDGDFTVSSLERLYSEYDMQDKLIKAYEECSLGSKTLIFNSSIASSKVVEQLFIKSGYEIKHLDSTYGKEERRETLEWFKNKPDAILTSVGILTTGFDEPTVETIILNRATRSLTLYHQMCGRGSRILPTKKTFKIIDLGNNAKRLGLWQDFVDWKEVFLNPNKFLESLAVWEEKINSGLIYNLPEYVKRNFPKTASFGFDMEETYYNMLKKARKTVEAVDLSIEDHYQRIIDNTDDLFEALDLLNLLQDEIQFRLRVYTNCMAKSTRSYFLYLLDNYNDRIKNRLRKELYK